MRMSWATQLQPRRSYALLRGLGLCLALGLCQWAQASQSLRPNHGQSPYPIWSELSYFESDTLASRHKAEQQDPKALLAFFMLASGERNLAEYQNAQRRVSAFMEDRGADLLKDQDPFRRANGLHQAMHAYFFVTPDSRQQGGYEPEQSKLSGIFANGQFNCISASLLYQVLLREWGLPTRGVLLPSHAFVEVTLSDGRQVEVETTSPNGFGILHDEAFYEASASWFRARGLQPSSMADYERRKKITPLQLAAMNMLNQHTQADRMAQTDAFRLAEISAWLDPSNALAQEKRLYFYGKEIETLSQAQAWQDLQRLFTATLVDVRRLMTDFADQPRIHNSAFWMHLQALHTYAQLGKSQWVKSLMDTINQLPSSAEQKQQETLAAGQSTAQLFQVLGEQGQFEEALLFATSVEPQMRNNSAWPSNITLLYNLWANHRWQAQDWPGVIDVLSEFFAQPYQDKNNPHSKTNLQNAYKNWLVIFLNANDIKGAKSVQAQCRDQHAHLGVCSETERALKEFLQQSTAASAAPKA
jgi:hypothetical protein